jgi:hypothetical protein
MMSRAALAGQSDIRVFFLKSVASLATTTTTATNREREGGRERSPNFNLYW